MYETCMMWLCYTLVNLLIINNLYVLCMLCMFFQTFLEALLKMWCGIRINVRYYHCVILTQIAHL
jgi:hypothetical protein